jgi:hypothetical protein
MNRVIFGEPQRGAAPAPTSPDQNLMFNIGGLSKMSLTVTVFYFLSISISQQFK